MAEKCNFRASHKKIIEDLFPLRISDSAMCQRLRMQSDISLNAVANVADHSGVSKQQNLDMLAQHMEKSKRVVIILSEPEK